MRFACVKEILKVKVGSIETEADALEACIALHAAGPSKVVVSLLQFQVLHLLLILTHRICLA